MSVFLVFLPRGCRRRRQRRGAAVAGRSCACVNGGGPRSRVCATEPRGCAARVCTGERERTTPTDCRSWRGCASACGERNSCVRACVSASAARGRVRECECTDVVAEVPTHRVPYWYAARWCATTRESPPGVLYYLSRVCACTSVWVCFCVCPFAFACIFCARVCVWACVCIAAVVRCRRHCLRRRRRRRHGTPRRVTDRTHEAEDSGQKKSLDSETPRTLLQLLLATDADVPRPPWSLCRRYPVPVGRRRLRRWHRRPSAVAANKWVSFGVRASPPIVSRQLPVSSALPSREHAPGGSRCRRSRVLDRTYPPGSQLSPRVLFSRFYPYECPIAISLPICD